MQIDATKATLIAAAIAATAALIGGAISGLTTIFILIINQRSEERRQLRELALKAAADNWRHTCELSKQYGAPILPFHVFIVHMVKLFDVLASKDLTVDNLTAKLREAERFSNIAAEEAFRATKKRQETEERKQSEASGQAAAPRQ